MADAASNFHFPNTAAKISLTTILVAINLVAVLAGFGVMWGVQTTRMDDGFKVFGERYAELRAEKDQLAVRVTEIEKRNNDDRVVLLSRLVGLEADTKYISQSVSELKLAVKGIR